jgi:hypothetical protein
MSLRSAQKRKRERERKEGRKGGEGGRKEGKRNGSFSWLNFSFFLLILSNSCLSSSIPGQCGEQGWLSSFKFYR